MRWRILQATHWWGGEFSEHLIRLAYARHLPLKGKAYLIDIVAAHFIKIPQWVVGDADPYKITQSGCEIPKTERSRPFPTEN